MSFVNKPAPGSQYYTTNSGCPILNPQASLRVGDKLEGTLLIRDINLLETIANITHERIPERIVHAKGAGAYGEFEVTKDISAFTSADFLKTVGKKTKLFARFSTVVGGRGSADTVRDTRGFAFKLYTDDGNLDWLFFSEPVFPIRDGGKFPSFVHAQKPGPQTNIRNPSYFWDFMSHNPETFHALLMIFSDRGTPQTYRNSEIFGLNTYKFTKEDGTFFYVKIHLKPNDGVKNMTKEQATVLAGQDPDFHSRDLFDAIETGKFPSWEVSAQIMKPEDAPKYKFNIFDATKTWSQKDYPLIPFGKITLNKNPANFHTEVEQASFNPTAIVPGWDVSADPILQTRLFAYGETARYRLGINFPQIPVNKPLYSYNPAKRDGAHNVENYGAAPSYFPSEFTPDKITTADQYEQAAHEEWVGKVTSFISQDLDIDYVQPRELWEMFKVTKSETSDKDITQADALVGNVAVDLSRAKKEIRDHTYAVFTRIAKDLGDRIKAATEALVKTPVTMKPALDVVGVNVPHGSSVVGGKPDHGYAGTA